MRHDAGCVLYKCKGCESYSDVLIDSHADDSVYIECDCGEQCIPVESPAELIINTLNQVADTRRNPHEV